jgi:hypothetical protein
MCAIFILITITVNEIHGVKAATKIVFGKNGCAALKMSKDKDIMNELQVP